VRDGSAAAAAPPGGAMSERPRFVPPGDDHGITLSLLSAISTRYRLGGPLGPSERRADHPGVPLRALKSTSLHGRGPPQELGAFSREHSTVDVRRRPIHLNKVQPSRDPGVDSARTPTRRGNDQQLGAFG
jgi:hypothetical protein